MRLIRRLRGRLLLANLAVAAVVIGTVWVGVSLIGPGYFEQAMGHRPGDPGGQMMDALTLSAFRDAIGSALVAATVTALGAAVVVSLALSSRIAGPVTRLAAAARRIAQGHYAERVSANEVGEVGELATAFNQMTASLEETERRRLQLVGDVAHELRTPLTTLEGYLEGLEDAVVDPGPATWALLHNETDRLTRMVADLQELWRAEARDLPLQMEETEVQGLIDDILARFKSQAIARNIEITAELPHQPISLVTDRERFGQIIGNYLSNALRYAPEASTVVVSADVRGREVLIAVRDQGPGLTAAQLDRVFERFYRVDRSRSRAVGGSGIGLAIARALATLMGGRAWAESEGLGTGATFKVALPVAA